MKTKQALIVITSFSLGLSPAAALDIVATTEPIVQGSGVGMTARYENVATQDGVSLDLFAEILAYSPDPRECLFTVEDDDVKFQFRDGVTGMQRNATIRWSFFENGTTNPVTAPNLALTIDDLDNLPTRQESLSTSDATGFELNDPTNVTATLVGSTVTAAGGIEQNSGDPEGAVRLQFANVSTFEISYQTIHGSALVSAYHHDGDGDFTFGNPVHTPIAPPVPQLYYTYNFSNEGTTPLDAEFFDDLPGALVWDATYTPVTTGGLTVQVVYSNGDKDAAINPLTLPPGNSTLTLKTLDLTQGGTIENVASLTLPNGEVLAPEGGGANIVLPPIGGVVEVFASSYLSTLGLTVTEQSILFDGNNSGVDGKVAVCENVQQMHVSGGVTGDYMVHPASSGTTGSVDTQPGGGGQPISMMLMDLSTLKTEAIALSEQAAGLTPTQTFGKINNTTTITSSAPGIVNVIAIEEVSLNGPKDLILNGGPNDYFILNIQDKLKFAGPSDMILTGGLTGNHVIVNMLPGSSSLEFVGLGSGYGIFLAVQGTNTIKIAGTGSITGSVAGRQVEITGNGKIVHDQFQ